MKNFVILALTGVFIGVSILIGLSHKKTPVKLQVTNQSTVPFIGSIEIRNGCGVEGAANKVADFLRSKNFDVKTVDNAETWNYPYTMVVSRNKDTTIASEIARELKTDKLVTIRNNDNLYDVTVFIGPDYGERIQ
jgi:hypothetical protein